jgi:multidrug resistance efflux pump
MTTDTPTETQSAPQPRAQHGRPRNEAPPDREHSWWQRGLVAFGVIAVLATVASLIAAATSSQETGPRLTHTVTRGDLRVTVTEQGTLESSENTEIKCKVRGQNTVIWVIESGTVVEPGDELVRLDTLFIQEQIDERTKYAHWSRSGAEHSKGRVAAAELRISEYEQGRYVSELMSLEKDLVIAKSTLRSATNMLRHAEQMAESGYVSELEVEEKKFALTQAELDVKLKNTELHVLKEFTKAEQLQTLKGDLTATQATHEANVERAVADASRRDRAVEEFDYCVVRAERGGLVIHPNAAQWETAPIEEGATVHKDRVLLLMPDLSKMQVKVGIHEAVIDRMKEGLTADVTLPDKTLDGTVSSVASVTRPAGWWTGNEVKYDVLVKLPAVEGLRPGMSAEVEVLIASYEDVLTIPVAAVVETGDGNFCWVKTARGTERRTLVLGDSNDVFTVVEEGLKEGDEVMLNPIAFREAQTAAKTPDEAKPDATESGSETD